VPDPVCFTKRGSDWENKGGEWRSTTVKHNTHKTRVLENLFYYKLLIKVVAK